MLDRRSKQRAAPPEPVEIIPFPCKNRVGLIRRTAERVHYSRTDREAADFRRRATDGLRKQMEKIGVPPYRISSEVAAFAALMEREILELECWSNEPGDSAA